MTTGGPFRAFRELYYRSALSRWRLNQDKHSSIVISTTDGIPGDSERGRTIVDGTITLSGVIIAKTDQLWREIPDHAEHAEFLHGFTWLRDLRDFGGEAARSTARSLVNVEPKSMSRAAVIIRFAAGRRNLHPARR